MSELLAIKASQSSAVVMFPFAEAVVAAAATARSCLIFRPNALLNDAYRKERNLTKVQCLTDKEIIILT